MLHQIYELSSLSIFEEALRLASAISGDGLLRPDPPFFDDFLEDEDLPVSEPVSDPASSLESNLARLPSDMLDIISFLTRRNSHSRRRI